MMGVFVQMNESSPMARRHPIGYIIQENGCWDWVGTKDPAGYGRWGKYPEEQYAHRKVFTLSGRVIPDTMELDHLCRNRACVNPDHLEPVTHTENIRRGNSIANAHREKTHCKRGHPLSGENAYHRIRRDRHKGPERGCKTCLNDAQKRRYHKRKQITPPRRWSV